MDYFAPGLLHEQRGRSGAEEWGLKGLHFKYLDGEAFPAYLRTEPHGGSVHSTTKVRVTYVRSRASERNLIVKLDVIQGACPRTL